MKTFFVRTAVGFAKMHPDETGNIGRHDWDIWETTQTPIMDGNNICLNPEILTKSLSNNNGELINTSIY